MNSLLQKLPATIVLGTLATVFLLTCRKHSSVRVRLWVWGWGFVLFHFGIRLLAEVHGIRESVGTAIDLSLLCFAGTAFAVSSSPIAEIPHWRRRLALILGTPAVILSCVAGWGTPFPWLSLLAISTMYFGTMVFFISCGWKSSMPVLLLYALLGVSGIWSIARSWQGHLDFPVQLALTWLFLISAIFFLRAYPRLSAGVVTTSFGFAGWACVWAISAFLPQLENALGQFNEFWNVPKYILAFGMILVLLEDEQFAGEAARHRERAMNQQLESFAELTSRLLSGENAGELCVEIASVITNVTTFSRIAVLLADEQQRLYLAAHSGIGDKHLHAISRTVCKIFASQLAAVQAKARPLGRNSYIAAREQAATFGNIPGVHDYPSNPYWRTGDELIVPICSPRGIYAGFFVLDEPRDVMRVSASEMSKLELLANDLGVAIDRHYLQRELVRTEKLAGIGQLVAGMAHELNNPLTAVLGYAEIISEASGDAAARQQASVIQRESLRMKRIIENLVRFAKQDRGEPRLLSVNRTLSEILKLWSYQAKSRGTQLVTDIEENLPQVTFDEPQLKQVLLNILHNAFDAVENSEKKEVSVRAALAHGIVSISVTDSGSGFHDPDRVFDPFFTTKGVGKGSGLGLSVCYGIVKQHGGDIRASNLSPRGARIIIELPAAQQELALATGS